MSLRPPPAHLILVGLPGVGKSTVGRAVAERLGRGFLDLDREIERRAGRPVSAIFANEGEAAFRRMERELTEELRLGPPQVVAPGGGWVEQPDLMALLRPPSRIIFLAASVPAVVRRMGRGWARRPLLAGGDVAAKLADLLARREPLYRQADLVLDTEVVDFHEIVRSVSALAAPSGPD